MATTHHSTTNEDFPPSAPDLSQLSPLPSLGSSSSNENESYDDVLSSSLSCASSPASSPRDVLSSNKEGETLHRQEHGDIKTTTKLLRPGSMLKKSYSFIGGLSMLFMVVLSWYVYPTDNDIQQQPLPQPQQPLPLPQPQPQQQQYDEDDPWAIWGQGFDFTKQREFWIHDEDLPEDIAADLQSTNKNIQREATIRRLLDPSRWETFGYWEIYHYFACDKTLTSLRPVWSEQLFRDARDFYHDFVENDDTPYYNGLFRTIYQATDKVYDMSQNAIPYQTGGAKGRGLMAARDIKRNELITQSTNNTIIFNDGHSFRKFLFAMNERFSDPGMVCDVLIWAWVQDLEGHIPFAGVVDLDNGNLLNDWELGKYYEYEEEREEEEKEAEEDDDSLNIRCRCGGVVVGCFANRDIMKGEELLGDYNDFESYYSWTSMGL